MSGAVRMRGWAERELAEVSETLATARAELASVRSELAAFTRAHERVVRPLREELAEIRAELAEVLATRTGRRPAAPPPAEPADEPVEVGEPDPDRARRLYRGLVKLCHPDLGTDEAERGRRAEFTARVNDAYAAEDAAALEDLAREWGADAVAADQDDVWAAVAETRDRLDEVRAETRRLRTTGLGPLCFGRDDPTTAIERVAARLRATIHRERDALAALR
ncbi:hypothetical protein [Actinophytocola gossypii]|uniref:J domain-containing protein n=1 Tax=Actinophytocola gossypii TaxID=2812003 RepID=A0ABT2JCW6_9PSEU|nr:hypothetical protein [Actinophytocola gossypii]MCT2585718.1 hypothetical protein [Actinophytocola gossypii]